MATSYNLNITEPVMVAEVIRSYEFREYKPVTRANLNDAGKITMDVNQRNMHTLPSEANLFFEGKLLKTDGTSYADTDAVTLTHNGLMHLFSSITCSLSNKIIESVTNTGQATTMFGMLEYQNDFQLAQG